MLNRNLMKSCSLLIVLLICANGLPVYAQSSNSPQRPAKVLVDEEFIKQAEINAAERDKFKAQNEAKDEVIAAQASQINALRGLLQLEKQISADWKESALARKDALKTDDKLIAQFEKREAQLQSDLAAAKRNGRWIGVGGFVLGVLATLFVRGNN